MWLDDVVAEECSGGGRANVEMFGGLRDPLATTAANALLSHYHCCCRTAACQRSKQAPLRKEVSLRPVACRGSPTAATRRQKAGALSDILSDCPWLGQVWHHFSSGNAGMILCNNIAPFTGFLNRGCSSTISHICKLEGLYIYLHIYE